MGLTIMILSLLGFNLQVKVLSFVVALPGVTLLAYWNYWALSNDYEVLNPSKSQRFFCLIGFVPARNPSVRFYRNIVVKNKSA
jgi:4-hydroxybenzoate polyprenyltransferase